MTVAVRVDGIPNVVRRLERLRSAMQKRVAREALAAGGKIMNRALKDSVASPPYKGLKKSIGRRKRTYTRTQTVMEIIGPRFFYRDRDTGLRPSAFAYSVEFGDRNSPPKGFMRRGFRKGLQPTRTAIVRRFETSLRKQELGL